MHIFTAFYGVLFPYVQEAAFSNYRLWESVGFTFAFAYSNFLCVWIKLTILVSVLGIGMTGYFLTEFRIRNSPEMPDRNIEEQDNRGSNNISMETGGAGGEKSGMK